MLLLNDTHFVNQIIYTDIYLTVYISFFYFDVLVF